MGNILDAGGVPDAAVGPRRYSGNRLIVAGAVQFQYDGQGRLALRSEGGRTWQYSWDSHDRLVAVTTPEGDIWRYRYDPLDRRIAKRRSAPAAAGQVPGAIEQTEFVWDGKTLIEQIHTDAQGHAPCRPGRIVWTTMSRSHSLSAVWMAASGSSRS